jgi:hypothetical protein
MSGLSIRFLRGFLNHAECWVNSASPSVCMYARLLETIWEPQDGFPCNVLLGSLVKNCGAI